MWQQRKQRLVPKNFIDYQVEIYCNDQKYIGFLANISDEGAGILLDHDPIVINNIKQGDNVTGSIKSDKYNVSLDFSGEVVWATIKRWQEQDYYGLGVQFADIIMLPDKLFVLAQAVD